MSIQAPRRAPQNPALIAQAAARAENGANRPAG
jgi:hypothetical protein